MMVHQEIVQHAVKAGLRVNGEGELWGNVEALHRLANRLVEQERKRVIKWLESQHEAHKSQHNYFAWAALQLRNET